MFRKYTSWEIYAKKASSKRKFLRQVEARRRKNFGGPIREDLKMSEEERESEQQKEIAPFCVRRTHWLTPVTRTHTNRGSSCLRSRSPLQRLEEKKNDTKIENGFAASEYPNSNRRKKKAKKPKGIVFMSPDGQCSARVDPRGFVELHIQRSENDMADNSSRGRKRPVSEIRQSTSNMKQEGNLQPAAKKMRVAKKANGKTKQPPPPKRMCRRRNLPTFVVTSYRKHSLANEENRQEQHVSEDDKSVDVSLLPDEIGMLNLNEESKNKGDGGKERGINLQAEKHRVDQIEETVQLDSSEEQARKSCHPTPPNDFSSCTSSETSGVRKWFGRLAHVIDTFFDV